MEAILEERQGTCQQPRQYCPCLLMLVIYLLLLWPSGDWGVVESSLQWAGITRDLCNPV